MSDEIKEILEEIKLQLIVTKELSKDCLITITKRNVIKLLDYITNLQEENEDLKNRLENEVATCLLRQQENERLIELCDKYEEEHNTVFQKWLKELKECNKC